MFQHIISSRKIKLLILISVLSFVFFIFVYYANAQVAPWPQFQHDSRHTGQSEFQGPQTGNIEWTFETPIPGGQLFIAHNPSSPAIGPDSTIYFGAGTQSTGKMYAVNPDGSLKWESEPLPAAAPTSPAVITDNLALVVTGTVDFGSQITALDKGTGQIQWSHSVGNQVNFITKAPDNTLYLTTEDGFLISITPTQNQAIENWRVQFPRFLNRSAPAVGLDGKIYIVYNQGSIFRQRKVQAIDPNEGSVIWTRNFSVSISEIFSSSTATIADDGTVLVAFHTSLKAFDPDNGNDVFTVPYIGKFPTTPVIMPSGQIAFGLVQRNRFDASGNAFIVKVILNPQDPENPSVNFIPIGTTDFVKQPVVDSEGTIYAGINNELVAISSDNLILFREGVGSIGSDFALNENVLYFTSFFFDEIGFPFARLSVVGGEASQTTLSNLGQFKSDGQAIVAESTFTTEDTVVFKGTPLSSSNLDVKLQVELREFLEPFTGSFDEGIIESSFIPSGQEASITRFGLVDGQYHWRARAVDTQGNASDWQEFGTSGNVDFEVKTVPLYTQIESNFPPRLPEDEWANLEYANGFSEEYDCGSTIANCGCALTSSVMVARYYDIEQAQSNDVNPQTLNDWLNLEPSGYIEGNINWLEVARYTGDRIKYDFANSRDGFNDFATLDQHLALAQPVIIHITPGIDHFLVVDTKLANNTYKVKDPRWYNTRVLDEPSDDRSNNIRDYQNNFNGVRLFVSGDGIAQKSLTIALASPGELLIADPLNRKLGKDPITNTEFNEIPNSSFFADSIDDATGVLPPTGEKIKNVYISDPVDGVYNIQISGTGLGSYTAFLDTRNATGTFERNIIKGVIDENQISNLEVNFSATTGTIEEIMPMVTFETIIQDIINSRRLNLIDSDGVQKSLSQKINRAKSAKERDRINASKLVLESFIAEVEAQKDKHINLEIANVLIANTQVLLGIF